MLSRYAEIMKYRMPIKQVYSERLLFIFNVNCCAFFTAVKEVMLLPWFVGLSVCLLMGLLKKLSVNFR